MRSLTSSLFGVISRCCCTGYLNLNAMDRPKEYPRQPQRDAGGNCYFETTVNVKDAVCVVVDVPLDAFTLAFATTVTTCAPSGVACDTGPVQPIAPPTTAVLTSSNRSRPRTRTVKVRRRHAMKLPSNRAGRKKKDASVGPELVLLSAISATPLAVVVMVNSEV